jgi:hypothetical protein
VFRGAVETAGRVRGIRVPGAAAKFSRKDLDDLTAVAVEGGAKGLVWLKVEADGSFSGPVAKNLAGVADALKAKLGCEPGDLALIVADSFDVTCKALHMLRKRLGATLGLYDPNAMHFSWVVDFPMFAKDTESGGWASMHHPFTAPRPADLDLLDSDPAACRAVAYDLVINGSEAGGGTIRIHDGATQEKVFKLLGITAGSGPGAVRLPARRPAERRPAARRHRPGNRSLGDAVRQARQHPRRDRLPEDAEGERPDDGRPVAGRDEAARGARRPGRLRKPNRVSDGDRAVAAPLGAARAPSPDVRLGILASALCMSAALRHPGFACSHSPALGARAAPR